jgi:hypothetical protein
MTSYFITGNDGKAHDLRGATQESRIRLLSFLESQYGFLSRRYMLGFHPRVSGFSDERAEVERAHRNCRAYRDHSHSLGQGAPEVIYQAISQYGDWLRAAPASRPASQISPSYTSATSTAPSVVREKNPGWEAVVAHRNNSLQLASVGRPSLSGPPGLYGCAPTVLPTSIQPEVGNVTGKGIREDLTTAIQRALAQEDPRPRDSQIFSPKKFLGDLDLYPVWRQDVLLCLERARLHSHKDKALYVYRSLGGEVAKKVEHLLRPLSDDSFVAILQLLDLLYGNESDHFRQQIAKVEGLPKLDVLGRDNLGNMVITIQAALPAIAALHPEALRHSNSDLMGGLLECLPHTDKTIFFQDCSIRGVKPSVAELYNYLSEHLKILKDVDRPTKPRAPPRPRPATLRVGFRAPDRTKKVSRMENIAAEASTTCNAPDSCESEGEAPVGQVPSTPCPLEQGPALCSPLVEPPSDKPEIPEPVDTPTPVVPCSSVEALPEEDAKEDSPKEDTAPTVSPETVANPEEEDPVPDRSASESEDDAELEEMLEHSKANLSAGILSMTLPVGVPPYRVFTTVILDTGSSQTMIDVDFARKLHVDLTPQRTMRVTFVDRVVDVQVRDCQITLLSQDEKQEFVVAARAIENLAGHAVLWPWNRYLHRHPHLADIKVPKGPASCKGTILIGTDNVELLQALEYRRTNRPKRPMGLRTTLGWAFMGPDPEGKESLPSDKRIRVIPTLKTSGLEKLLQRQFDIENLGTLEEEPSPFPSSNQGPKDPGKWSPGGHNDERQASFR